MQKRSRAAKLLLGVLLLFVVASCFYPALSVGHICLGDDCPVCLQVQFCARLIRTLAFCISLLWLFAELGGRSLWPLLLHRFPYARPTPISLKVKLSD